MNPFQWDKMTNSPGILFKILDKFDWKLLTVAPTSPAIHSVRHKAAHSSKPFIIQHIELYKLARLGSGSKWCNRGVSALQNIFLPTGSIILSWHRGLEMKMAMCSGGGGAVQCRDLGHTCTIFIERSHKKQVRWEKSGLYRICAALACFFG